MPPTLASRQLLDLTPPEGACIASLEEATVFSLDRGGLRVTVTVPVGVLEWWAEATDSSSGVTVRDWLDYEGYDRTPWEELDREMADDVESFVGRLIASDIRLAERSRAQVALEWRSGDTWSQAIPLVADTGEDGV